MTTSTRDQLLTTARTLFAERGFYGVSIANIADEHGLTKQALLHHFPSKEKLYGEVLTEISTELEELQKAAMVHTDAPKARLTFFFMSMLTNDEADAIRTRLLMRELLDNKHRAEKAGAWYLKPFLKNLIAMVKAIPHWSHASDAEALALVYQLLGTVNYYAISGPTLQGIFGRRGVSALRGAFGKQFETTINAVLAASP